MLVGELTRFDQLIGLIYEGATDPSRWMTSILPAMANYLQVPQAYLLTTLHTPQNGGYFSPTESEAHYYSLMVNGDMLPDAVWFYPEPKPEAQLIQRRVAFWKGVKIEE